LHRVRAWAFLVRSLVRATTHSHLHREWDAQVRTDLAVLVRLVPVAQVAQVVRVVLVRLVPVAQVAHLVQVSAALVRVALQAQLRVALQVSLARAVAQVAAVVAELAAEPPVPSVRAAARAARPASQSVRNAKSMNRDKHRALVARLFHAETAPPSFVCDAVQASKISQTRSMQTQVS
jgi:hypothetical protein